MQTAALGFLAIPSTDWLYQFTNNMTALTTTNAGALTSFGMTILSFVALMMLVNMVFTYSTANMAFTLRERPFEAGTVVMFLVRLVVCLLLESFWNNPVPATSISLNHLFSAIAQDIVAVLDQNSLQNLNQLLSDAGSGMGSPAMYSIPQQACYWLVQLFLALASAVLFVINASSFVFYGITALFGPLFIPLYMTNSFRGKFLHFVEVLASFAMMRAVAAAFIFVWEGFINTFLQQTFHGDYSMSMWIANFIPFVMVFVAFMINMLFIPAITQVIFGGGAYATGGASNLLTRLVALAAA